MHCLSNDSKELYAATLSSYISHAFRPFQFVIGSLMLVLCAYVLSGSSQT